MDLQVGMYIRYKYGKIEKIKSSVIQQDNPLIFASINCKGRMKSEIIGEPSFDPIDLIEVGDYVNGYLIGKVCSDEKKLYTSPEYEVFFEKDIKSIVTKEQFEAITYKVEIPEE